MILTQFFMSSTDFCLWDVITRLKIRLISWHWHPDYVSFLRHFLNTGYQNKDWYIQVPVLDPETALDLTPELIEETLKYFILSSERLSQMTKTYNDIDAVTRLLEEVRLYHWQLCLFPSMKQTMSTKHVSWERSPYRSSRLCRKRH